MSVFNIKPSPLTDSSKEFIIPPTILSDYNNYLMTEVPNATFDFERFRSWYNHSDDRTPYMMRAEYFPINWKSKVGNSDMNYNFYVNTEVSIRKGDIVVREDGLIAMLNWNIQTYINAQTTQAIECNHMIKIQRWTEATADRRGFKTADAHYEVIADYIPCSMTEYQGRPDYQRTQGVPGIVPDMLTVCDLQYNEYTKNIKEEDVFEYGQFMYHIIHIDQTQIEYIESNNDDSTDNVYGIIRLYCRKKSGDDI